MQEESNNFSKFSERTEILADELGLRLSDLPQKMGISASMFHSYRSGKYSISTKVWRKLNQSEKALRERKNNSLMLILARK